MMSNATKLSIVFTSNWLGRKSLQFDQAHTDFTNGINGLWISVKQMVLKCTEAHLVPLYSSFNFIKSCSICLLRH